MAVKTGKDFGVYSSDLYVLAPLHSTQQLILLSAQLYQGFFFFLSCFPFYFFLFFTFASLVGSLVLFCGCSRGGSIKKLEQNIFKSCFFFFHSSRWLMQSRNLLLCWYVLETLKQGRPNLSHVSVQDRARRARDFPVKKFVGEVLQNGFLLHFFSGIGNNGEENKKKR